MGGFMEALAVGKVIGDVVEPFVTEAKLTVQYGSKQVANGREIKPSLAADKPHVRVLAPSNNAANLYTLVMVDPDAPSPSEPTFREWLHWIVVDIPEGSDATQGKEVVSYMGPNPRTGIHRYVFVAFKQREGSLAGVEACLPEERANFNTRNFASKHALALPVAVVYFNSQRQPAKSRRSTR
ncbi:protein MOTHER of FT and TFL1 homolog 2-like [Neltuma alba]|uniref:protein MOTHER of FT and TFL1 homolog 2-like n=1 Tax=Neltuma alba TaxID=207710 RepID=UPI0010A4C99E|nr:protein MOTHER of FT and TFL1 homolog 2-like [Prosopis alba]